MSCMQGMPMHAPALRVPPCRPPTDGLAPARATPHADLGGAPRACAVGARQGHAGTGLHHTALAAGLVARNHQRGHLRAKATATHILLSVLLQPIDRLLSAMWTLGEDSRRNSVTHLQYAVDTQSPEFICNLEHSSRYAMIVR